MSKHILLICGEASGDMHAAQLSRQLRLLSPGIRISAVGGPLLREAGADIICDIRGLSVLGLFDVIRKLPRFFALKDMLLRKVREEKPDAVILVDFSGFNLRFARAVNNQAPVIYYVSPQVWASRPGRIETIRRHIRKMIVIFKFEEEMYRRRGVDAVWVGHPLLDAVKPTMSREECFRETGLSPDTTTIALLPGSRKQEINHILPVMLAACRLMRGRNADLQFIIAKSPHLDSAIYDKILRTAAIDARMLEGKTRDCLNIADFCLVASGTATLETAIMQKPFVIIYKMGLLNYLLYRPQVRIPYIGMVNIAAGRKIIPEFIQFNATPRRIADEAVSILRNPAELNRIQQDLAAVRASLGETGAAGRAAKILIDTMNG